MGQWIRWLLLVFLYLSNPNLLWNCPKLKHHANIYVVLSLCIRIKYFWICLSGLNDNYR